MKQAVTEALGEALARIQREDFVRAILTGKRRNHAPHWVRVDLRPVEIRNEILVQAVMHDGTKDFTKNLKGNDLELKELLDSGFANVIVDSTTESFQIQITKKEEAIVGISKTKLERDLSHDRSKERLLLESDPIFRALGMADSSGRIKPSHRDKYIQIDQLLRILEPIVEEIPLGSRLRVIDLACGSAALTLAVHIFLSKRFAVETLGIERNSNLVAKVSSIVSKQHLQGIQFENELIEGLDLNKFDLVLALHACDTATDDAISFVIGSRSSAALIVPCCHQSRPKEVKESASAVPMLAKDGILYERFADLLTDGLRAERLRSAGYQVEVMEFVPDDHTARNLLIRATAK